MIEALEMTHLPPSGSIEAKSSRMDDSDFIDGPTFVTIRTLNAVSEVDGAEQASESPTVVLWPGRVQLAAICYCFFLIGWSDGTNGPLIPRIQDFYHVSYSVVSLIFVMTCAGFVIGVVLNVHFTDRLDFGKVLVCGALLQIVGYSMMSPAPPFPALVLGLAVNGIGRPLQDSQANAFVACARDNKSLKLGLIHALYGLGAFSAPFASTRFAQIMDRKWAFHYLASLGIAIVNVFVLAATFRGKSWRECLQVANQLDLSYDGRSANVRGSSRFHQVLRQKPLYLLALFSLLYVGVEMTIGGWTVSYIIQYRKGGPSSGYISSGFFGGLALGRVALLKVNAKIGEQRAVCLYAAIAIALQIIVYVVPSLTVNAVAVSFVGFFLGPMYPILMNVSGSLIPPVLLPGSLGIIAGTGMIGSALLPFATGALAQKFGIASLQPFLIALTTAMMCLWICLMMMKSRWMY